MTWDRDLEDLLTTTVIYTAPTTMDVHGAMVASTSSAVTIRARVEHETKVVRDSVGREVVSITQLYLKPTTTTGGSYTPVLGGTFTLPSGNAPLEPPIIQVLRLDDAVSEGAGSHHWEVNL